MVSHIFGGSPVQNQNGVGVRRCQQASGWVCRFEGPKWQLRTQMRKTWVGLDPYVSHSHKLAPENLGQISEK